MSKFVRKSMSNSAEGYTLNKKKELVLNEYQAIVDEVNTLKVHYTKKNKLFRLIAVYLDKMLELELEYYGSLNRKVK